MLAYAALFIALLALTLSVLNIVIKDKNESTFKS